MNERNEALRAELVALAAPQGRSRSWPSPAVALAGFLVGGMLSGGAVAAYAVGAAPDEELIALQAVGEYLFDGYETFGDPFAVVATGSAELDPGDPPDGASTIALVLSCDGEGRLEVIVDGAVESFQLCTSDARPSFAGLYDAPVDGGPLRIEAEEAATRFAVWGSWTTVPPQPEPSAAQAQALADGVVDEAEYRAGLARYASCLDRAGFGLIVHDDDGPLIDYSVPGDAETEGANGDCYLREFASIDSAWQLQLE